MQPTVRRSALQHHQPPAQTPVDRDEHEPALLKQWGTVFPGAAYVSALIDRFVQHCHIVDIDGDSWRQKESLALSDTRTKPKPRPYHSAVDPTQEALTVDGDVSFPAPRVTPRALRS